MLYDARSDEIHRFDSLTGQVFEELRSGPQRPAQLVAAMSERLGVLADAELTGLVGEILRILNTGNIAAPLG